jgi:hypothetical protein
MSDNIYGHNFHCPKCATHLTSLFLCGECGIRYDEWFAAWQENQRLREALEFYANEKHYDGYVDYDYQWTGEAKQYDAAIEGDRGEIARRALEGGE